MNKEKLLDCKIITPKNKAKFSIIWLHGLGASNDDFLPVAPLLRLDDLDIRFIFPQAPEQAVTINMGYVMPAWYDIRRLDANDTDFGRDVDENGIINSIQRIEALIAQEQHAGVPSERIFLVGFSQGGALALATALQSKQSLAGIIALSAYLAAGDQLLARFNAVNSQTPIFMAHGLQDTVVAYKFGCRSRDYLQQRGHPLDWHAYPMAHEVCPEEINDMATWLRQQCDNMKASAS
ncbi:MAG: alpha/beta fold hydrolase [Pseudomonadota bacterium]